MLPSSLCTVVYFQYEYQVTQRTVNTTLFKCSQPNPPHVQWSVYLHCFDILNKDYTN